MRPTGTFGAGSASDEPFGGPEETTVPEARTPTGKHDLSALARVSAVHDREDAIRTAYAEGQEDAIRALYATMRHYRRGAMTQGEMDNLVLAVRLRFTRL